MPRVYKKKNPFYGVIWEAKRKAEKQGLKMFFVDIPCKHGHLSERFVINGACRTCTNLRQKEISKKRLENNPDYYKQKYAKNSEKHKAKAAAYREKNPEKVKESCLKSKQKRRPLATAAENARRAMKLNATPVWLTENHKQEINMIYSHSRFIQNASKIKCHVDHIVPLKSEIVCGLHVPWNLRIVSQRYNNYKSNKLDQFSTEFIYIPNGVAVHSSALPWNWSN